MPTPAKERLVREVMKGIGRKRGSSRKRAATLAVSTLRRGLSTVRERDPETGRVRLTLLRDRVLLLLGFAGSFSLNELSGLVVSDLEFFEGQGRVLLLRRSRPTWAETVKRWRSLRET